MLGFSGLGVGRPVSPLPGQCFIDGNAGMTTQALGHLVAEDWLRLCLPWWNPYAGVGLPLAAEMQPAAFFLPFVLLLHFASGVLWLKLAMQMLAGLFTFACLRALALGRSASLCGAVLYALNGTFAWFGDAPTLPVPFLPLLIYSIERSRALAQSGAGGGWLVVAGGLGLSLVAGFPETAFADGVLGLLWCVFAMVQLETAARWRFAGKIVAGGVCGLCLSAPAVVPFLDGLTRETIMVHGLVATDQLLAGQEAALLMPTVFGPPYADFGLDAWGAAGGYLGVGLVLPGLYSLLAGGSRRSLAFVLAGWCLFWVAVFLHTQPAFAVWRAIPVLNQVDVTRYAMPSVEFCAVVLAAMAVDDSQRSGRRRAAIGAVLALAVLLGGAAFTILIKRSRGGAGLDSFPFAWPSLIWAGFLGTALAALLSRHSSAWHRAALCGLMTADALASFIVPGLAGAVPRPIDRQPADYLRAHGGLSRSYSLGEMLSPNYGSYFGVATLKAFYEPLSLDWANYLLRLDPRVNIWLTNMPGLPPPATLLVHNIAAFEAVGVRYVLVGGDGTLPPEAAARGIRPVLQSPSGRIYELPDPTPYFQVTAGSCRLAVQGRQDLEADCPAQATLKRLEFADPGWHARAGKRKLPISRTGEIFQQVTLPAGHSHVHFGYAPPYSRLIAILFGCGLLMVLGAAVPHWFVLPRPGRRVQPVSTPLR